MAASTCRQCGGSGEEDCNNPYCVNGYDTNLKIQCPICKGTLKKQCLKCDGRGTT